MISIKEKPRHLYARLVALRRDYPCESFCRKSLVLTAELENRNIDLNISLILCDNAESYDRVLVGEPTQLPDERTVYIAENDDDIIRQIGEQLQVKRRSEKSDTAIMDWVIKRVTEYANSRIL